MGHLEAFFSFDLFWSCKICTIEDFFYLAVTDLEGAWGDAPLHFC